MLKVHFVGIVYFNVCMREGQLALLPNGMNPDPDMPPHYASLFVETDRHDSDNWWPDHKFDRTRELEDQPGVTRTAKLLEFRLAEPAEITFDCGDKTFDNFNLETALPKVSEIVPEFELDEKNPDTIATVPIPGGKLEVLRFDQTEAVVTWSIAEHADPVIITAKAARVTKHVTLKPIGRELDTEIVLANTPDILTLLETDPGESEEEEHGREHGGDHTAAHHFSLYARLGQNKDPKPFLRIDPRQLTAKVADLAMFAFEHPYFDFLRARPQVGLPGCLPSCC